MIPLWHFKEMANRKNTRWNDFDIIEPAENKTSETPVTI